MKGFGLHGQARFPTGKVAREVSRPRVGQRGDVGGDKGGDKAKK